ncbi:MAG TPA: hypothetical protein VM260_18210 [Pirellula sp.]|nr:hypothetical protein [Pirellula sp.]
MESFGAIVKITLMLVKWADSLFAYLHDQGKISEGEDIAIARAAAALLARSKRVKEIEDAYLKMSMDEVRKDLEKNGEFHD